MTINYGFAKFFNVLDAALVSSVSLQERLAGIVSGVSHLKRDSFPDDETWKRFEELMRSTTNRPAEGHEGTIAATTSRMNENDTRHWIGEAFGIFSRIAEACGKTRQ